MPLFASRQRMLLATGLAIFFCTAFFFYPAFRAAAFQSQSKSKPLLANFWQPLAAPAPGEAVQAEIQTNAFLASPAQQAAELRLDDGTIESGGLIDGLILLNRITPPSYPATLQRLRVLFPAFANQPDPTGKPITVLIGTDSAGSGTVPAFGQFTQINSTVPGNSLSNFYEITIPNGPTITSGDFYIGYRSPSPHQGVGFAIDANNTNTQVQNRTYASLDGGNTFSVLPPSSGAVSAIAMMRAVVTLPNVASAPTIDVTPASLDFGTLILNASQDRAVTIRNTGGATLTVNSATSSNPRFAVLNSTFPLSIASGTQQVITVRFAPTAQQTENGTISISSNDPTRGTLAVPVTGAGAQPGSTVIPLTSGTAQSGQIAASASSNCSLAITQYSIVVPTGAASLQIVLNGTQDLDLFARYNSIINVQSNQIVADFRANSLGNNEVITITPATTPALQAGTYYIAISNCSTSNANFTLTATVNTNTTGQVSEELSADDGSGEGGSIVNGAHYVNRLTPSRYPSRLQRIRIYFAQFQGQPEPTNQQIRLIAFNNPANNSLSTTPSYFVDRTVTIPSITSTTARFVDYDITENAVITEGDWVVGFILPNPANGVGCAADISSTLQNRSFARASGSAAWQQLGGNFLIRAVTLSGTQPTCNYALTPTSQNLAANGGTGTVNVTVANGCAWTATSNTAWLTINSGASGTGNGAVGFTATANPGTASRTGTLTVAGQTFTVTQAGQPCTYSIAPASQSYTATGGNGTVAVTSQTGCAWTANSNVNWITITNGASGSGNGNVAFTVAALDSPQPRTGTLTVAGQTFTVTQAGVTCTFQLTPTSQNFTSAGGTGSVNLTTNSSGCQWTATSNANWLTVTSGAVGTGNGTIGFSVAANATTESRTGTSTIGGQTFTVTQAGANVVSSVSAASYASSTVAPDSIVAAFGTNLATQTEIGSTIPLPTSLAGTSVRIRDSVGAERLAQLFFVSGAQINYLLPAGLAQGAASVLVTSGNQTLSVGTITVSGVAPGLFTANSDGRGVPAGLALRVKADGSQVYESLAAFDAAQNRLVGVPLDLSNANEQVFLILFGTGFRNVAKLSDVVVQIAGANAEVLYAGTQGGLAGLDQINVRLSPSLAGRGNVELTFGIGSRNANPVTIAVK